MLYFKSRSAARQFSSSVNLRGIVQARVIDSKNCLSSNGSRYAVAISKA